MCRPACCGKALWALRVLGYRDALARGLVVLLWLGSVVGVTSVRVVFGLV